uniref:Uncharacterized protein n=1 Tax=viral metagenome TaxID=1070528 RepID=A0A6C0ECE2_9ZZZZ
MSGKLKESLQKIKVEKDKQEFYKKTKSKINNKELTKEELDILRKYNIEEWRTYINEIYEKKYGDKINFCSSSQECIECIYKGLFNEKGTITDEEVKKIVEQFR